MRWCQNSVLDAIFSSYFSQAQQQGIQVEASLAVPDKLPVDAVELSTVFANALENAIHACAELPEGNGKSSASVSTVPRLMFEVANTCVGEVRLGPERPARDWTPWPRNGHTLHRRFLRKARRCLLLRTKGRLVQDTADPVNGCKPRLSSKFDGSEKTGPALSYPGSAGPVLFIWSTMGVVFAGNASCRVFLGDQKPSQTGWPFFGLKALLYNGFSQCASDCHS